MKRLAAWLLGLAVGLPALAVVGLWAASAQIGRTPLELIGHAERQLQDEPALREAAAPLLALLRWAVGGSPGEDLELPFEVPPLPPHPAARGRGAASAAAAAPSASAVDDEQGPVIRVGPQRAVKSLAMAARLARDGSVVEVDPGDYHADVAVWDRAELTIRGTGPQVRLFADGASAEGKAIWVIRGGRVTVEGIAFIGARVPDRNGAGIRAEGGHLVVRRCLFYGNQTGILTGARSDATLEVEDSEFAYNGGGDGFTHHLYAGAIDQLKVSGSLFHHANRGHLIKSRARRSVVTYNRLADDVGGRASYELEFPQGGDAVVVGNLIEQSALTSNSVIVSFGAEGYRWPVNRLQLVHNTLVNDLPSGGTFVKVAEPADAVLLRRNLLVGSGALEVPGQMDEAGDMRVDWSYFSRPSRLDYRPRPDSAPLAPDAPALPESLRPTREYLHPAGSRPLDAAPRFPGAFQTPAP